MNILSNTNFHEALSLYCIDNFEREKIPDIKFLRKIFSELHFSSYLKVCQVCKAWHQQATKLNKNEWENPTLVMLQMKRYLIIRDENREKNHDFIEFFIFKNAFTTDDVIDKTQIIDSSLPHQIKVILLSENYNEEELQLSETFKKAISNFELNGKPHPYYCCIDFCMDTNGFYEDRHVNWVKGIWGVGPLDESTLSTGESIVIYNSSNPIHFAVYLRDGIYLSLFGKDRGLQAANLDDMMSIYNGDVAYKLTLLKAPYENQDKSFAGTVFNTLCTLWKVVAYHRGFAIGSFNP
jgi:hypothetical protein